MTLEQAFYIIGIVTMSLILVLMIGLVAAVFVIKSKINHLHRMVSDKVQTVSTVASTAKRFFAGKK
jgi:cell division protein FtsL